MTKDFQLGKYFRVTWSNSWNYLSTPYIWFMFNKTGKGIGISFLGANLNLFYYPNGDARESMFSYEFYDEDYCEDCANSESDYCNDCVDHVEFKDWLTKDNVALRDEI